MKKCKCLLSLFLLSILLLNSGCSLFNPQIIFVVENEDYAILNATTDSIPLPEEPQKEGFTFDGWYLDKDIWANPLTLESLQQLQFFDDIKVYAKWIKNEENAPSDLPNTDNDEPSKTPIIEEGNIINYDGHRYQAFNLQITWLEAKEYCESLGGHLATITSAEEQAVLELFAGNYWLGATDEENEGDWLWITGEDWGYENWLDGEPNDLNGEHYLVIWPNTWNDLCMDSAEQSGFICEWDDVA